jgi:hypothetical protein
LASKVQWYCPVSQNVIAIVPQIGAGGMSATPSSSSIPIASNQATQSFSAVLEQVTPPSSVSRGMGASTSQGSVQGNYSSVNGTTKREAKSADSKTSDSQGRGNTSIQTPPSKPDAPDKTVPVVAAQVMPSPALAGNAGIKDFTPNEFVTGTALNDQVTSSSVSGADSTPQTVPIVAVQPMPSPALPGNAGIKDFTPNKLVTLGAALNDQIASSSASGADSTPQTVPVVVLQPMSSPTFPGNTGMNDDGTSSPISGVDSTTEPDAIAGSRSLPASFKGAPAEHQSASPQESASMVTPGTGEAAAVASLITGLSGALASDSKTQPGSVPLPLRNVSHGPRETIDDDNQAQTAAKSATDPFVVPLTDRCSTGACFPYFHN